MAKLKQYRLADPAALVPMPDRGGRLFSQGDEGETVNVEDSFYAALIADRDIVPVGSSASRAEPQAAPAGAKEERGAPAASRQAHATTRGGRSPLRPSVDHTGTQSEGKKP